MNNSNDGIIFLISHRVKIYNHHLSFTRQVGLSDSPKSEIINGPLWMCTTRCSLICQTLVGHIGGRGENVCSSEVLWILKEAAALSGFRQSAVYIPLVGQVIQNTVVSQWRQFGVDCSLSVLPAALLPFFLRLIIIFFIIHLTFFITTFITLHLFKRKARINKANVGASVAKRIVMPFSFTHFSPCQGTQTCRPCAGWDKPRRCAELAALTAAHWRNNNPRRGQRILKTRPGFRRALWETNTA